MALVIVRDTSVLSGTSNDSTSALSASQTNRRNSMTDAVLVGPGFIVVFGVVDWPGTVSGGPTVVRSTDDEGATEIESVDVVDGPVGCGVTTVVVDVSTSLLLAPPQALKIRIPRMGIEESRMEERSSGCRDGSR
ncbi:MAG: hypothetical protein ACKOJ9_05940 [Actinomycetota bacterium]